MIKEENLIVMLGNYNSSFPKIVAFSEVKDRFEKEYWINLKEGTWGKTDGSWVDCSIGSGWGYINRMSDCPDIFGVFDKTNIEHLNSLCFMARNAEEKHYFD